MQNIHIPQHAKHSYPTTCKAFISHNMQNVHISSKESAGTGTPPENFKIENFKIKNFRIENFKIENFRIENFRIENF